MMKAVSISETSVNFYQTTRRNITEDSNLHTRRRENLKSHHKLLNCFRNTVTCRTVDIKFQHTNLTTNQTLSFVVRTDLT
jgi:hypothetical protein